MFDPTDAARMASIVNWMTKDGKAVVRDVRQVTARRVAADQVILDFDIMAQSRGEDVQTAGNAHHGGFHFRAAEEVQGPATTKPSIRKGLATYIRPPQAKLVNDDIWSDAPWTACMFSVKGNAYVVVHMNHPDNPGPVTYSTRPYGRFGAFFTTTLQANNPLHLRYRIMVLDGKTHPNAEQLAALYADYV